MTVCCPVQSNQDNRQSSKIVIYIVVYIRLYLLMMDLDTPETCRGWGNILRIGCASSWFFFQTLHRDAQSTEHKVSPECWFLSKPHGVTFRKTEMIFTTMRVSYLILSNIHFYITVLTVTAHWDHIFSKVLFLNPTFSWNLLAVLECETTSPVPWLKKCQKQKVTCGWEWL
jgi:hypothetical protein